VILFHVGADLGDDKFVAVSAGHEPALTPDDPIHGFSLLADRLLPTLWLLKEPTRIQICGPIVVEIDGARTESLIPGRQGRLLFALLVLNRHRLMPRSEVVDSLWPDEAAKTADASLSVLLSRLRRAIDPIRIEGRGTVRLIVGSDPIVDLEIAEDAIHRAESAVSHRDWARAWAASQSAMFTARRGFLPGEDAPWIDDVRRRLEELHLRALEAYGEAGLGLGGAEVNAAREAGRSLVRLAPLRESGHRLLMRAFTAEGNPAEALRAYERLRTALRDEMGVSPSLATQRLFEEILG